MQVDLWWSGVKTGEICDVTGDSYCGNQQTRCYVVKEKKHEVRRGFLFF